MFNDKQFNFHKFFNHSINYSLISKQNLIILNQIEKLSSGLLAELKLFLNNNGTLIIFPFIKNTFEINTFLKDLNIESYGNINNQGNIISNINYKDPIYRNVFEIIPENIICL